MSTKVKLSYLIALAFKNVMNHKRHMFIIIFGFTLSISIMLSVNIWAKTSESLAINDFLDSQDYQAYLYSSQKPEDINLLIENLKENPLVDLYNRAYSSFALFNTENKSIFYRCLPEDSQQDPSNPISITNGFICDNSTLSRIDFIFNVEGNFSIENNKILISLNQANELAKIYNKEIQIGDTINISIAKYIPNPAYGQDRLDSFELSYFTNYTINGIYTIREGISIIQSVLSLDWLSDSIIFSLDSLSNLEEFEMQLNDVPYFLFVKFNKYELTKDGLNNVINKMQLFSEQIKKDYPLMYIYLLDSPFQDLISAYSRASISIVFMIPIIIIGLVLITFTINIVIETRQNEVVLLRDRGADTFQIVLMFIIEFIFVGLIGIIFGIGLSFILAAAIPSITSQGFSTATFLKFLLNLKISIGMILILPSLFILALVGYASLKIWWEISLRHKTIEHEQNIQRKTEKNIFTGISVSISIILIIAIIFSLIETITKIHESQNFSILATISAGYTFTLFCLLLIFISQGLNYLLVNKIHISLKGLYRRLVFNDAFFLFNNLKRKDKRLSTISFAIIIISSIIVFSLITNSTITNNQQVESEYKKGADLRISTFPINYSFQNNLTRIEGINEVTPILKTTASIAYTDYTIYGVEPLIYSRVGKWIDSSFSKGFSYEIFQNLENTYDGIIISKALSERLNITLGDKLPITSLPGGIYYRTFTIVGMVISAPALGLADGQNIEMYQQNEGFVIINLKYMLDELSFTTSQLFLASVLPGEDINKIINDVQKLLPYIQVNPPSINEQFIGAFILSYIPNIQTFLYIELGASILILFTLLIIFTEFTLNRRSQEFAILLSMGSSSKTIAKLLFSEITIIILGASLVGMLLGFLFTYSTIYLIIPLLTSHNIIPLTMNIPSLYLALFPIVLLIISLVGILPSIIKHGKEEIITTLRS